MNKKIVSILISVVFWTTYACAVGYGLYKFSDTTHYLTVEKTGASSQEIIPAVSGKSIAIRNIEFFVDAACSLYLYQGSSVANKVILPPCDQDGNFGYTKSYVGSDSTKSRIPVLDAGNALNMWTSADPDEGWVRVEFDYVNADYE